MTKVIDTVSIEEVAIDEKIYYKISNVDRMRPFFMSITSDTNHWMFISSNGGLTAGRKNADYAFFPYYTDDKVTESAEYTGSKTILQIDDKEQIHLWEPFSIRNIAKYNTTRNLYKNQYGNSVLFEEINHDLQISYRYEWCSSKTYGFVRKSRIVNNSSKKLSITFLDGIQNILPAGVPGGLQSSTSNLVDAYKRNELHKKSSVGIFALSAIIVDKAEPSEALKANTVWSTGLDAPRYLLSSRQLHKFRNQETIIEETDVKGERGAYFVHEKVEVENNSYKEWYIVCDVNQTHSTLANLIDEVLSDKNILKKITADISQGTENLISLNASSDALQCTQDTFGDTRHFANVLFNIMRGGVFDNGYAIEKSDVVQYLSSANKKVIANNKEFIEALPDIFSLAVLKEKLSTEQDPILIRLLTEYLPIKFSRRHGDPSRPWNKFSINTINEKDGSKILDYEGNWRDIFQNWEALVHSFPGFIDGMIFRFLNASTFDGYNPYRVTKSGFDWETIEPDDPWSYIGYWGDHQIIYLLKFLEFIEKHTPGKLKHYLDQDLFVYANVPYRIKSYEMIVEDPKDTIAFDEAKDAMLRKNRTEEGGDGALLKSRKGDIYHVNFLEKILATTLAKISNYIPEGGIWMNTQRPEWNDANNALVGNGVSMVTLCYLRRFLHFFHKLIKESETNSVEISNELLAFYTDIKDTIKSNENLSTRKVTDEERKQVVDKLGTAASIFRNNIYDESFSGERSAVQLSDVGLFLENILQHIDHTISVNKRSDNLFHAYNLLTMHENSFSVEYLSEMLEGQVAVLSSGYLSSEGALQVLDGLKKSALFRPDQYSYILYPNKKLPGFLEKNIIPASLLDSSALVRALQKHKNKDLIVQDVNGVYHFNSNFRNAKDLAVALEEIGKDAEYSKLVENESSELLDVFETVFNHKEFTGRSGTFYGYEGLGSIYWHMVSKLLLAAQECCLKAIEEKEDPVTVGKLLEHFYEINEGIGVHKSPTLYGAFPTDPYSHTPAGKGAQQPGMTGQVKEDILSRFGELGVFVSDGSLSFDPCLLRKEEFLQTEKKFHYIDIHNKKKKLALDSGSLAFTYCQIPIIYRISKRKKMKVTLTDGTSTEQATLTLNTDMSTKVFQRSGDITIIEIYLETEQLR